MLDPAQNPEASRVLILVSGLVQPLLVEQERATNHVETPIGKPGVGFPAQVCAFVLIKTEERTLVEDKLRRWFTVNLGYIEGVL